MGWECAFLIICAILPSASTKPSLLSSEHDASTKLRIKLRVPCWLKVTHLTEPLCTVSILRIL